MISAFKMIFSQMKVSFSEGANTFASVIFRLAQFLVEHDLPNMCCLFLSIFSSGIIPFT